MAQRDAQFFRRFFRAVNYFHKFPDAQAVKVDGYYISKTKSLKLFRSLMQKYRPYSDDNELINLLYLNQARDNNLRRLLQTETSSVFSKEAHEELENINNLPPDQQDQAFSVWTQKQEDEGAKAVRRKFTPSDPTEEEKKEKEETGVLPNKDDTLQALKAEAQAPKIEPKIEQKPPENIQQVPNWAQTKPTSPATLPSKPAPSPPKPSSNGIKLPKFNTPNAIKNFSSWAQRLIARSWPRLFSMGIGAAVGGSVGQLTGVGLIPGAAAGSMVGGVFPEYIKHGGGEQISKTSRSLSKNIGNLLNRGGNAARVARGASTAARGAVLAAEAAPVAVPVIIVVIVIALILILFFFFDFSKIISLFPPYQVALNQRTNRSPTSVSSCRFTYKGVTSPVPSSLLKTLAESVSRKTGVPAAVLLGVAAHENPTFTFNALDDHDAFFNRGFTGTDCQIHFDTSPTGALGLMQVQAPPNLRPQKAPNYNPGAASLDGLSKGASFFGKTLETLTTSDFCDVEKSLYLGAGVLISKNGGTPPTTSQQIKDSVCGYYGSCIYDNYNYGEEVQRDFENCSVTPNNPTVADSCPISNGTITCGSNFSTTNSCQHCSASYIGGDSVRQNTCQSFPGTFYAIDILGNSLQEITLPKINGQMVEWEWISQENTTQGVIQKYAGTNIETNAKYYLQFHHAEGGSQNQGTHYSGEIAGRICRSGCDHVHIQIGLGGRDQSGTSWVDAEQYLCKKI